MRIAGKPFSLPRELIRQIKFISPNIYELIEIAKTLNCSIPDGIGPDQLLLSHISELKDLSAQVNGHVDNIFITLGAKGMLLVRKQGPESAFLDSKDEYIEPEGNDNSHWRFYSAEPIANVVNVSGAGDSFNSGFITAMIRGKPEPICVAVGFESAITALRSQAAVPDEYFSNAHSCWAKEAEFKDFWISHFEKFFSIITTNLLNSFLAAIESNFELYY